MRKFFRNQKPVRRKLRKLRKTPAKPSKTFTKKVERIIHKNLESKQAATVYTLTAFNSGINSSGDLMNVIPGITQGIQDNNRIGDQIRAQKLKIKGYMTLTQGLSTTVGNARIGVRLMLVYPKMYPSYDGATANAATWLGALLKTGATTHGFVGSTVRDLYAPINTDAITVGYDRVHHITMPYYNVATSVGLVTQDLKYSTKFFTITKKLRNSCFKYDSTFGSAGLYPANKVWFLVAGYVHLDGSAADVATTVLNVAFDSYLDFEDA